MQFIVRIGLVFIENIIPVIVVIVGDNTFLDDHDIGPHLSDNIGDRCHFLEALPGIA